MRQLGLVGLKTPIVVEAAVGKDGTVSVPRADIAVDCGFAAYPEPSDTRVYIVGGPEPPGGVGEPGVPPFAPALCNAIFRRDRQADPQPAHRGSAPQLMEDR